MIVFCAILLLIHQGSALAPVTTVQLGESVTLGCVFPSNEIDIEQFYWFKQSAGGNLKLIVSQRKYMTPVYASDISASRLRLTGDANSRNLTILRTIQEDEGMYHCGVLTWIKTSWSGTFLLITGNDQRTSNYSVVQWPTVSDPVHPGDSVTLQCSVLSDSDNKMCTRDDRVFWFRVGSHKSQHSVIYTDGGTHEECDEISDTQKRCFYRFSESVSSSDVGAYYCAVATCGEILFGHGTKVEIEGPSLWSQTATITIFVLCGLLAISLIVITLLIYAIKCDSYAAAAAVQKYSDRLRSGQTDEDKWVYSAVIFTMMRTDRGAVGNAKAVQRKKVYAAVKAFGLDS